MENKNDLQKDFIESMISIRHKKNLTQTDLSNISDVSQPVIARLEKGKTDPQLSTIIKLLDSMGAELTIKEENMDYFVTVEKEVLREVASSLIAILTKYVITHNIKSDSNNPIRILLDLIDELNDSIISNAEYTQEDLKKISAKLEFAKDYINKVVESDE